MALSLYLAVATTVLAVLRPADAFAPTVGLRSRALTARPAALRMAYVPDGLSAEEWKKIQAKEKEAQKNLGRVGPSRFKSRSFQAWQEAGGNHLFPVDPVKVKRGEIAMKDVPYMQRGGAWDDSDLTKNGKPAKAWSKTDKEYASGGFRKEQSISIFGGAPLPWTVQYQKMDMNAINPVARQKNWKRPASPKSVDPKLKARLERELKEQKAKEAKKKAAKGVNGKASNGKAVNGKAVNGKEVKKGFMGLW